jgi:Flp pilus assembly protein TadD
VARANLGIYQRQAGDLPGAMASFRQALEVFQAYRMIEEAHGVIDCLRELGEEP